MPTLNAIRLSFGENIAETWLMAQLEDLNVFCGVKEKASVEQMLCLSQLIISKYWFLKVSELMLFFANFKLAKYGLFYGVVDPIVISSALMTFNEERIVALNRIEKQQETERKERERAKHDKVSMSREEYEELKWLFNM